MDQNDHHHKRDEGNENVPVHYLVRAVQTATERYRQYCKATGRFLAIGPRRLWVYWHEIGDRRDRLEIFFTLIIAFATATYSITAWWQFGVMNRTLTEIQKQTTAAVVSANAAATNADIAKKALQDSEYPYVALVDVVSLAKFKASEPLNFRGQFLSAGRIPAFEVYAHVSYYVGDGPSDTEFFPKPAVPTPRSTPAHLVSVQICMTAAIPMVQEQPFTAPILQIGERRPYDFSISPLFERLGQVVSGELALYIEADIYFRGPSPQDPVQNRHSCLVYYAHRVPGRPTPDRFIPCPTGYAPREEYCPPAEDITELKADTEERRREQ